jgi:predicted DsbA family dithiol-disulfide isomerase
MSKTLTVQVWGDIICPMCPIGHANLEKGIALSPHRDDIEVVHHSFRLRPGVAVHSVESYVRQKHGANTDVASLLGQVEGWAAKAGLVYRMAKTRAGDTMDAHRLVHLAATQGLQRQAVQRLQLAHFAEEENIFDRDTLVRLGVEIGLDRDLVASMLAGERFKADVVADETAVRKMGVASVPFFLIGDQIAINGTQSPQEYAVALDKAWALQAPVSIKVAEGMACGPTECVL